jgi:putative DNA primase/helicase
MDHDDALPEASTGEAVPSHLTTEVALRPLVPISAHELLARRFPVRPALLAPLIPASGLAMLYAPRGVGKTYLALSIAHAVATGGTLLPWHAPKARRVLYVDGEMPAATLQARLRTILGSSDHAPLPGSRLMFLAADLFEEGLPNLADAAAQRALTEAAQGADLIVLDNLSSLASGLRENEADDWTPLQRWLLALRRAGKSVLLVHHAGKGGQQRGTSRREDVMDTVIALRRPRDYRPEDGARFEVHIEKARGLAGADLTPFVAAMQIDPAGRMAWSMSNLGDSRRDEAAAMLSQGASVRDIAAATGLSKSAVHRMKQ